MEFLIITGMSGAGKSQAANCLEDVGYYCVDNIPPLLIPSLVELSKKGNSELNRVAIVTDIRGGEFFKDIPKVIESLKSKDVKFSILFLDTSDETIKKRYKENRRSHPLCGTMNLSIDDAISAERAALKPIREIANYFIDTTHLSVAKLREQIIGIFFNNKSDVIQLQCISFGFKYGPVADADLVFDVRCLPNPFYVDELVSLTGLDDKVQNYILNFEESRVTRDKIFDLIDYLIPLYCQEGKSRLVIAFGCTGGKHRSVTFAEKCAEHLKSLGYRVNINHRDINRV